VHFHARQFKDFANPPPPNPVTGKIPKWKNDKEIIEMMLATLKNNNVVKVITAGSLTTIQEFKMADPERFIPSLGHPDVGNNPLPDTASFARYFQEKKFSVFGELGLQYVGKTLEDPGSRTLSCHLRAIRNPCSSSHRNVLPKYNLYLLSKIQDFSRQSTID
jgi:hypothetical protein